MPDPTIFPRTDLALERRRADLSLPGIGYEERSEGCFTVTTLTVGDAVSSRSVGRPIGRYLTVGFPPLGDLTDAERDELVALLGRTLSSVFPLLPTERKPTVLVAGLGNRAIVSDAVGPETVGRITATSHLYRDEPRLFADLGCWSVGTSIPGVLADTGVETSEILSGVCRSLRPDFILAIDSLAARSPDRLMTTVQISDTGIRPGAGIGNARPALDRSTLGVPVIAVGVPTVVECATLVADYLTRAGVPDEDCDTLSEGRDLFYVTPKDVDLSVGRISRMLADVLTSLFSLPCEKR